MVRCFILPNVQYFRRVINDFYHGISLFFIKQVTEKQFITSETGLFGGNYIHF